MPSPVETDDTREKLKAGEHHKMQVLLLSVMKKCIIKWK